MSSSEDILEELHHRLLMYTGENTLKSLAHFLSGYSFAIGRREVARSDDPLILPLGFHDWVAYRLHFSGSSAGWCNMICERSQTEEEAIDRFFSLLAEMKSRQAHLVAKLMGCKATYPLTTVNRKNGEMVPSPPITKSYPDSISVVTYTSDPGFFVYADNGEHFHGSGFFASLDKFEMLTGISRSLLTIVDDNWPPKSPPNF